MPIAQEQRRPPVVVLETVYPNSVREMCRFVVLGIELSRYEVSEDVRVAEESDLILFIYTNLFKKRH